MFSGLCLRNLHHGSFWRDLFDCETHLRDRTNNEAPQIACSKRDMIWMNGLFLTTTSILATIASKPEDAELYRGQLPHSKSSCTGLLTPQPWQPWSIYQTDGIFILLSRIEVQLSLYTSHVFSKDCSVMFQEDTLISTSYTATQFPTSHSPPSEGPPLQPQLATPTRLLLRYPAPVTLPLPIIKKSSAAIHTPITA
jgi:hypothetical protein